MEIARIRVERNRLQVIPCAAVTRGLVGASVVFEGFGSEWEGLSKTAVFHTQAVTRDVVNVQPGEPVTIPWEVLETAMTELMVGVCGTNKEGTAVITSAWGNLGMIVSGASPVGRPEEPPTATWTQQMEGQVNAALEASLAVRPLAEQAAASAGTAAEKARIAGDSERAAGGYAEAAENNAHSTAQDAQYAGRMAAEAAGRAETAGTHAQTAGAASTAAAKSAETASAFSGAAAEKAQEAAVQAANAKTEANRASAEADRAAGLIDDTVISKNKTNSSRKIREDFTSLRDQILRNVCPVMNQSGSAVTCTPLADVPLQVNAEVRAAQQGHGQAAMDNVRNFIPCTGMTVVRNGVNYLNLNAEIISGDSLGFEINPETGRVFHPYLDPAQCIQMEVRVPRNCSMCLAADKLNGRSYVRISNGDSGGSNIDATINSVSTTAAFNTGEHDRLIVTFYGFELPMEYNAEGIRLTESGDGALPFRPYFGEIHTRTFSAPVWASQIHLSQGSLDETGELLDFERYKDKTDIIPPYEVSLRGVDPYTSVLGFSHGLAQREARDTPSAGLFFGYIYIHTNPVQINSVEDWYQFLDSQKAAGTPVQVICEKKSPVQQTLEPVGIKGIKGINKIYTSEGSITVSGLSDPGEMINGLAGRLTDLENRSESLVETYG